MWLKESKYRDRPRHLGANTPDGTVMCGAQLGASKYSITYKVNIWHKTAYIIFFGTREEERAYHENETKKYMAKYPDKKLVTKTITVTVKSPDISKKIPAPLEEIIPTAESEEFAFPDDINNELPYQTREEYEKSIERAITIFNSQPGTDEFKELAELLPLIKGYESANIKFPLYNALEAIKLRMKDFSLAPNDLIYILGNKEDVELFLSCEKIPSNVILKKVYKMLGLKIPADRKDFIR